MLVNHADSGVHGIAGAFEVNGFIVDQNLATIALVQTVEHVHEGRFAGTVFAKKANNLTGLDNQVDVVVSNEVAKAFGDAPEF